MSEEEFARHREALAAQRLEKPKQLSTETNTFWGEITSQQYHFDRTNVEVAHLRTLTKDDIIEFYKVSTLTPTRDEVRLREHRQRSIELLFSTSSVLIHEACHICDSYISTHYFQWF